MLSSILWHHGMQTGPKWITAKPRGSVADARQLMVAAAVSAHEPDGWDRVKATATALWRFLMGVKF